MKNERAKALGVIATCTAFSEASGLLWGSHNTLLQYVSAGIVWTSTVVGVEAFSILKHTDEKPGKGQIALWGPSIAGAAGLGYQASRVLESHTPNYIGGAFFALAGLIIPSAVAFVFTRPHKE